MSFRKTLLRTLTLLAVVLPVGWSISSLQNDLKDQRLFGALVNQNPVAVRAALEAGANPDSVNYVKQPALIEAMYWGPVENTELLLRAGAAVDGCDSWGRTPLMWAASQGRVETVRLLLAYGADHRKRAQFGNALAEAKNGLETARENKDRTRIARQQQIIRILSRLPGS